MISCYWKFIWMLICMEFTTKVTYPRPFSCFLCNCGYVFLTTPQCSHERSYTDAANHINGNTRFLEYIQWLLFNLSVKYLNSSKHLYKPELLWSYRCVLLHVPLPHQEPVQQMYLSTIGLGEKSRNERLVRTLILYCTIHSVNNARFISTLH